MNKLIKEAAERFNFISNYNPKNPQGQGYKNVLSEIKGDDETVFTYDFLVEMREGKIDEKHPIFEILHNVKDILQINEAYDSFSEFMSKLRTDKSSLQSSNNAIRQAYSGFVSGTAQQWKLIKPDEYLRCINEFTHFDKPLPDAKYRFWGRKVVDWVAGAKDNVEQFAANSYLSSGPTLAIDDEDSQGRNLLALLWYNLTGDEEIPYRPGECSGDSDKKKMFFRNYCNPFRKYIGTKYCPENDEITAYETDSALDGFFNIVASFDKNYNDFQLLFLALDKLIHLAHNRGTLAHLFMEGGNVACSKISNS